MVLTALNGKTANRTGQRRSRRLVFATRETLGATEHKAPLNAGTAWMNLPAERHRGLLSDRCPSPDVTVVGTAWLRARLAKV